MKKNFYINFIIFLCALLVNLNSFGQVYSKQENYYKEFDKTVGLENTSLFNGIRYKEKYRTRNGEHKFYKISEYQTGNIIYDEQPFFDIDMKYDIYEDEIIVKIPTHVGYSIFQLINTKVNQFSMNNTEFVTLNNYMDNNSGFFEIVYQNSKLILYKKHQKIRKEYIYKKSVFNNFKIKNYYLLHSLGKYHKLKSHKDLVKIYPEHKKKLRTYFKKQKKLMKSNYNLFMERSMDFLNTTLNQNPDSNK